MDLISNLCFFVFINNWSRYDYEEGRYAKNKEVLRLKYGTNLSTRQIYRGLNISTGVISIYINRAESAGLSWPLPETMTEYEIALIMQPKRVVTSSTFAEPDFNAMQQELTEVKPR